MKAAIAGVALGSVMIAGGLVVFYESPPELPPRCAAPEVAYDRDYCAAFADGSLLDPMPDSYVHVRDICAAIPRCRIDGAIGVAWDRGWGVYDDYFETYVVESDARELTAAILDNIGGR